MRAVLASLLCLTLRLPAQPRAITLDDLYRASTVTEPRLSPDGALVAYVVTTTDRKANRRVPQIYVADTDARTPPRLFAASGANYPRWRPDGKLLAFVATRPASPKPQVYALPLTGGDPLPLTDLPEGVTLFDWSPDGARLVCVSRVPAPPPPSDVKHYRNAFYKQNGPGFEDGRRAHLYVVDLATRRARQLTNEPNRDDVDPQWSPDGVTIAFVGQRADQDILMNGDVWTVAASGGAPVKVSAHRSSVLHPRWSPDGRRIAYLAAESDDQPARLWLAAEGKSLPAWRAEVTLPDFAWSSDQTLDLLAPVRGEQHAFRTGVAAPLTTGPRWLQSLDVNRRAARVAFVASDFTHPPELFVADAGFQQERRISHTSDALLADLVTQTVERFTFAGVDGLETEAFLVKPAGWQPDRRYPVVLSIHGGPSAMYGVGWSDEFQLFAAQGWAFLYVNPRGSYGYGEPFRRAVEGEWGGKAYEDLMRGVDAALQRYPWLDGERLAVRGQSFGGFMTNWIVSHTTRFRAAVTMSSISNFLSLEGTRDAAYSHSRDFGGDLFANSETFWKYSPVRYAAAVKTPVLVLHGDADHRVPLEQGEQWFRALQHFGVPSELFIFPREDHSLHREPAHAVELMQRQLEWFARFLNAPR